MHSPLPPGPQRRSRPKAERSKAEGQRPKARGQRQEAEGWRPDAGGWSQRPEAGASGRRLGGRRPEAGRPEAGDWRLEARDVLEVVRSDLLVYVCSGLHV